MAPKSKGVIERVEEMLGMGHKPKKKRGSSRKKAVRKAVKKAARKLKAKRPTNKAKRGRKSKR